MFVWDEPRTNAYFTSITPSFKESVRVFKGLNRDFEDFVLECLKDALGSYGPFKGTFFKALHNRGSQGNKILDEPSIKESEII